MKNVAEILKFAPEGLKLYSLINGEVEFDFACEPGEYPISVQYGDGVEYFDEYGKYFTQYGECTLFPSKDHRTWDNWQEVLMPQCVGSVFVDNNEYQYCLVTNDKIWLIDKLRKSLTTWFTFSEFNFIQELRFATAEETEQCFNELDRQGYKFENGAVVKKEKEWSIFDAKDGDFVYDTDSEGIFIFKGFDEDRILRYASLILGYLYTDPDSHYGSIHRPCLRPATDDEINYMLEKLDERGYLWNPITHRLLKKEETSEEEFTIEYFKPFDKVLVRDSNIEYWRCDFFSTYLNSYSPYSHSPYGSIGGWVSQCVPYNEETAHLLGTTEKYNGKYKTWEEE